MSETKREIKFLRLANHALRSPMTIVSGALALLENIDAFEGLENQTQMQSELIHKAKTRANEVSQIFSDTMLINEFHHRDIKRYHRQEYDLNEVIEEAIEGFNVEYKAPSKKYPVLVNIHDFVAALRRLLESSIRWGVVRVQIQKEEDTSVAIQIFDEGPELEQTYNDLFVDFQIFSGRGVAEHSLSHIFAKQLLRFNGTKIDFQQTDQGAKTELIIPLDQVTLNEESL